MKKVVSGVNGGQPKYDGSDITRTIYEHGDFFPPKPKQRQSPGGGGSGGDLGVIGKTIACAFFAFFATAAVLIFSGPPKAFFVAFGLAITVAFKPLRILAVLCLVALAIAWFVSR